VLLAAALLVALLATADAPTGLLLHPPGHPSLPLVLLTVMSNAPQAYVSALVGVYLVGALLLLAGIARRTGRSAS
jgi:ABC-type Fe3+ transport system permease subunit